MKTLTEAIKAERKGRKKPKSEFPPTAEQQAILDLAQEGHSVIMIEAGAGTGKTTTDRMLVDVLTGIGQYTAFNSSLVAESKEKFAGTLCSCNTTHSLAFRAEGKRFAHRLGGNRVRAHEVADMLGIRDYTIDRGKDSERRLPRGFLASQVMGAIRKFCQSADREITADCFKYMDGLDNPTEDGRRTYTNNEKVRKRLLPYAKKAWADISDEDGTLPFQHDHYVKIWQLNRPVISASYILLDEAQDTAPVMLDILSQQLSDDRQNPPMVILVGDSAQQIYEWRGAVNALGYFPDAPRRFLSQSFRFGQAIADVANAILETLEDATELRLTGFDKIKSRVEPIAEPTAILCRTNALAVATFLGEVAGGKRPFLVGGGKDVIAFVRGAISLQEGQSTSHPDLACFLNWGEVQDYADLDEGEDLKLMVKLIDEFGAQTILDGLLQMPKESEADITISTAHKSKGREWRSVRLSADFPTNSKSRDADRKLLYVAATRAKEVLDVSQCPFFTGDDSVDISAVIASQPKPEASGIVPPTPSTPPAVEDFTWAKLVDGSWGVRGPGNQTGKTVTVIRRDGSESKRKLKESIHNSPTYSLYRI